MSVTQQRYTRFTAAREPNAPPATLTLYVLECEDDCWYVGITGNMERRWREHSGTGGAGAAWTKRHRPISIHSEVDVPEPDARTEEGHLTARLMMRHGINKVRGGTLTYGRPYDTRDSDVRRVAGSIRLALGLDYYETKLLVQQELQQGASPQKIPAPAEEELAAALGELSVNVAKKKTTAKEGKKATRKKRSKELKRNPEEDAELSNSEGSEEEKKSNSKSKLIII